MKNRWNPWPKINGKPASQTREYFSYRAMIVRCLDKTNSEYRFYGAKGITPCQRWVDSFWDFYQDMGPRPDNTSIDRIDPTKGYYKENCRWADPDVQYQNRKSNILDKNGKRVTKARESKRLGITVGTLRDRIKRGTHIFTRVKNIRENKTGYFGVFVQKRKESIRYGARITVKRKKIMLGYFNTPQEAHKAYLEGVKKYRGQYDL